MQRILIIATIAVIASAARAEDAPSSGSLPSSEKGPTSRPHNMAQHSLQFHQISNSVHHSLRRRLHHNNGVHHYKPSQSSGATLLTGVNTQPSRTDEARGRRKRSPSGSVSRGVSPPRLIGTERGVDTTGREIYAWATFTGIGAHWGIVSVRCSNARRRRGSSGARPKVTGAISRSPLSGTSGRPNQIPRSGFLIAETPASE
jgi:hypothetical protein